MSTGQEDEEQATHEVITALANHGVVARPCASARGVNLTLAMARNLLEILEDLRRIEERGCV